MNGRDASSRSGDRSRSRAAMPNSTRGDCSACAATSHTPRLSAASLADCAFSAASLDRVDRLRGIGRAKREPGALPILELASRFDEARLCRRVDLLRHRAVFASRSPRCSRAPCEQRRLGGAPARQPLQHAAARFVPLGEFARRAGRSRRGSPCAAASRISGCRRRSCRRTTPAHRTGTARDRTFTSARTPASNFAMSSRSAASHSACVHTASAVNLRPVALVWPQPMVRMPTGSI